MGSTRSRLAAIPARALVLGTLLFATAHAEEQFYWIDPALGVDAPAGGSEAQPWKTMGYALTQPLKVPARLLLLPGIYSEASGESFPIDLPTNLGIWGALPEGAVLRAPHSPTFPAAAPVFRVALATDQSGWNTFGDFELVTDGLAFDLELGPKANGSFDLNRLEVDAARVLESYAHPGSHHYLYVGQCRLRGSAGAIGVESFPSPIWTSVDLQIHRSELATGSAAPVVTLAPQGENTAIFFDCSNSILHTAGVGVQLNPSGGASILAELVHSLFWGLGSAGVAEVVRGGSPRPTVEVINSVFWNNAAAADLPDHDPTSYTLVRSLFEDPQLAALAGGLVGPPLMVDPAGGDWHSLPASPTRDAGLAAGPPEGYDRDGDPRLPQFGGDGLPDVGPDESFDHYVYLHPPLAVGQTSALRAMGAPGDLALTFIGPPSYWPPFGSGPQLTNLYQDSALDVSRVLAGGYAEALLSPGVAPAHVGFAYMLQTAFYSPATNELTWSANAFRGWLAE